MESKDGYEKELHSHIEQERAAVTLQSKVGELLYDKGIELVLFRNHLTDVTISEILNLHEYAKKVVNKPIDVFTTSELAVALMNMDVTASKLDIGKLASEWLAEHANYSSKADFLTKKYSEPVYVQIDVLDYNKRIDGQVLNNEDFYKNPQDYTSDFGRFSKVADIFMAGHFHGNGAPDILTREMLQAPDNKIQVVADISCDVDGPIACTIKASTIADPFFGYLPLESKEVSYSHPAAILVMSVDNLPCELPKDASEGFGEMFMEHVIPAFFNGDKEGILQRAKITESGKLTPRFSYLQDYVDGK